MKPVFHKKQFTISTQQPKQNEKKQNDSEPKKQPKQTQMNEQFYQPQQFNHYQYQQQYQHHQIVQVTQPLQNNQYNQQKQFQQVQNTQKDSQKEIKQQTQIYNQNNSTNYLINNRFTENWESLLFRQETQMNQIERLFDIINEECQLNVTISQEEENSFPEWIMVNGIVMDCEKFFEAFKEFQNKKKE